MKRTKIARRVDDASPGDLEQSRIRAAVLAGRLEDGYRRIDEAIEAGEDVEAWEEFWITLLHQYESLCDDLAAA
jgi:hypothetical protein